MKLLARIEGYIYEFWRSWQLATTASRIQECGMQTIYVCCANHVFKSDEVGTLRLHYQTVAQDTKLVPGAVAAYTLTVVVVVIVIVIVKNDGGAP